MFPTHVGMNRKFSIHLGSFRNVPHTRGDEPAGLLTKINKESMFPTHVGMNRIIDPVSEYK